MLNYNAFRPFVLLTVHVHLVAPAGLFLLTRHVSQIGQTPEGPELRLLRATLIAIITLFPQPFIF